MKRLLIPLLNGRNIVKYYTLSSQQRQYDFSRRYFHNNQSIFESDKFDEDSIENESKSFYGEADEERTLWQKVKRAMVWQRHLEPEDEEEEIDPEDMPDPDAFNFRRSDYVFWVYLILAGVIGLVFMKLQSSSRPFYFKYLPIMRRTMENLDNKILFTIIRDKAWGRIISLLEEGLSENQQQQENEKSEKKDNKVFYYHKNFELILKNIFGDDVKKSDLRLLNTNFICKPSHFFYMLPMVIRKKGIFKKLFQMTYYESRFEVILPIIHQKTKICCVLKVCLKTSSNPYDKKNFIRRKIESPLQLGREEPGRSAGVDPSIPTHQRQEDTLGDIDFEDTTKLEEIEKSLSEEEMKLSQKELKRYISLVEEEERRLKDERKAQGIEEEEEDTKRKALLKKNKNKGVIKNWLQRRKKLRSGQQEEEDDDSNTKRGLPEFRDLDVEIENVSLMHVKSVIEDYDAKFFDQLPLHLINQALRFNWPYESETYEIVEESEDDDDDEKKRKMMKKVDPDYVNEIIIVKNNDLVEKVKVISKKLPIFVHPGEALVGFVVPTEHEKKYLPVENTEN